MKIELKPTGLNQPPTVLLSHRGQVTEWNVSAYFSRGQDRLANAEENRLFEEINAYWDQLSQERQQHIWNCYQQAREILDTHYDITALTRPLMEVVRQLYDLMPLGEIGYWARFRGIRLPASLKETYDPRDIKEKTYLRADYQALVVLAIALRPMLPIWGEYIDSTQKDTGNAFKEFNALKLLRTSQLIDSEPLQRLMIYIKAMLDTSDQAALSTAAALAGLGTAMMPTYLLALTVVRRLTVGEVNPRDDSAGLISGIHSYVSNNYRSIDRKLGATQFGGNGKISDKLTPEKSQDDNKSSTVEMYKTKQEVSDGDLQIQNIHTEYPYGMLAALDPTVDEAKLQKCLEATKALNALGIEEANLTLVGWVIHRVISARAIPHLTKDSLLRCMAVAQACLWEWGFYDLAVLVTATPLVVGADEMRAGIEGRGRISRDLMSELEVKFPHFRQRSGKQVTLRQQNVAARAADKYSDSIMDVDWQLHAPPELIALSSRINNTKRLKSPYDTRIQVARLFLKVYH